MIIIIKGLPRCFSVSLPAGDTRDTSSITELERHPGVENINPLQFSCLENSMDGEAWWATVHGVAKSQTQLSDFTFPVSCIFNCCFKFQDPKNN